MSTDLILLSTLRLLSLLDEVSGHYCTPKVGTLEVSAFEVSSREDGILQVGSPEVSTAEISIC
jgi:hypothetical protein